MRVIPHERLRRMAPITRVPVRFVEPKRDWKLNALKWALCAAGVLAFTVVTLAHWFRA